MLLDIGCNDGTYTCQLMSAIGTRKAYGIELSAGAVSDASTKGINVICADLNKALPLSSDSFDVIIANQVIEHLYFTDDFVDEIHRILKPNGILIISTTNLSALHYRFWLLFGMQPSCLHPSRYQFGNHLRGVENPIYGHKSVFTHRAFREFLKYHGFKIEREMSSCIHPLPPSMAAIICKVFVTFGLFSTIKAKVQ